MQTISSQRPQHMRTPRPLRYVRIVNDSVTTELALMLSSITLEEMGGLKMLSCNNTGS